MKAWNVAQRSDGIEPAEHYVDTPLGIEDHYSLSLHRLAVRAGTSNSFIEAEKDLQEYCCLDVSSQIIRKLCQQEAPKMQAWRQQSSKVQKDFIEASGNVEIAIDGTYVNTMEGWRDVKVALISKRRRKKSVAGRVGGS